jgi:hypothetical protein
MARNARNENDSMQVLRSALPANGNVLPKLRSQKNRITEDKNSLKSNKLRNEGENLKMPNFKIFVAVIFTTFLLAALFAPVFAVTYNLGVTTGQYVKYGNFVGTGPGFEAFGDYGSLTLQITNVAGNHVTLLSTGEFQNGTAIPGNGTASIWDIAAGTEDGAPNTQGPIIAANLNAGDPIPPPDTYTVNSTESRQYIGVTRSVNILSITISTPDYNSSLSYVYDKASGMLLESSSVTTAQGQSGPVTSEYSYSITQTNIFSPTSNTPIPTSQSVPLTYITAAIIVIVIASAIVLLLLRKRV